MCRLADAIDWPGLDTHFAECYSEDMGRPGNAIRLMVGPHYLKYAFDESDESVIARWVENPYWQYFCGFEYMQHDCPIHPTSMAIHTPEYNAHLPRPFLRAVTLCRK